ncbi:hypothetical protein [Sphingomonas sp.]|jgi:hypothetical protein|uniref:hypothetical protein n=1 Tax=Sphingomonas sp. TaxID=28214 RepID=UPI002EDA0E05
MIAAFVLAALLQTAPAPSQAEEFDIVVIGRRLSEVSVTVGRDPRGKFTCGLNKTTGNARLDRALCTAAATCVRKGARDGATVRVCVDRRKPDLLADIRKSMARRAAQ